MSNSEKSWSRAWSAQEIIENAPNWSLAGDMGLLKHLEAFSEDLLSQAKGTSENLEKLSRDLDGASLALDLVKNQFLSLHNVQFIESRVYEDDETQQEDGVAQKNKDGGEKEDEETRKRLIKEEILKGFAVVDKFFDKVEVPASDSEDETDFPSFVLQPKDPYIDRPLPYVIGTDEWHKKWHVGLQDSSSESEEDKVSEKYSETDSETDLPVANRQSVDFSLEVDRRQPVANSTFNDSIAHSKQVSNEPEDYSSAPNYAPIRSESFAKQLAEKLSDVEKSTETEKEVNTKAIQKSNTFTGRIFFDEPPPLDDEDDLFPSKSGQKGLFPGGGNLFDDLDEIVDNSLWEEEQKPEEILPPRKVAAKKGGIFDDEDNSESELFSSKPVEGVKPFLQPGNKTSVPLFDEEPPDLEPVPVKKEKPSGADLMVEKKKEETPAPPIPKKVDLFADDAPLFEDDLFSNLGTSLTSGLFGAEAKTSEEKPEIVHEEIERAVPVEASRKVASLFDSFPPELDEWEGDIFNENAQRSNLFDDEPPSLFGDDTSGIVVSRSDAEDFSFVPHASSSKRLSSDLFREEHSDDSLFDNRTKSAAPANLEIIPEADSGPETFLEITPSGNADDLFDSSPSKNNEEKESPDFDLRGSKSDFEIKPLKTDSETGETNEKRDPKTASPGKLKHNLNINVAALLPGAAPRRTPLSPSSSGNNEPMDDFIGVTSPETLHSVTKERARIPIKRKPSTRRGRQESLRRSGADFQLSLPQEIEETGKVHENVASVNKPDFFEAPTVQEMGKEHETDLFGRQVEEIKKPNLFEDFLNQEDDLFSEMNFEGKAPITGLFASSSSAEKTEEIPKIEIKPKAAPHGSLFGDDEDGDLFAAKKLPSKASKQKSLFDDDDGEDDLFGPSTSKSKDSSTNKLLVDNKKVKTATVKKLENSATSEDPLSSFFDE